MRLLTTSKGLCGAVLLASALAGTACQQAPVSVNENTGTTGTVNINSNSNANMSTSTVTTASGAVIEAREPDKYTANVVVSGAATGQQQAAGSATLRVARNGSDRRYSIDTRLPGVGEIIFLDKADKRYLILPAQRKYAELTAEMTGGFDIGRSLTPGQLVAYLERQQGVERVGDETLNGRAATKYRVAGRTQTQTQAGQVQGESFIYVDKETSLPLRIEGFGQSTGNVQGVTGGNLVAEMRDIRTDANPSDFELPQGYARVTPEEVRQMSAQLAQGLQFFMNFINQQQGGARAPAAGASPAASPAASPR